LWNVCANEELTAFICEIVAVVAQQIVVLHSKARANGIKKSFELCQSFVCATQNDSLVWTTVRSALGGIVENTPEKSSNMIISQQEQQHQSCSLPSKVILSSTKHNATVPHALQIEPQKLLRHLARHALRKIVQIERDLFRHFLWKAERMSGFKKKQ
jgi:hypothetical protein